MKTLAVGCRQFLAFTAALVLFAPAYARAEDEYPFRNSPPFNSANRSDPAAIDPWRFFNRQCTSFVAWRLNGRTTKPFAFQNFMAAPSQSGEGHKERWGNAEFWDDHARALGYAVNKTPARGAIAHWNPGEGSASRTSGHVAWVESVNGDGTVTIEEYNALVKNGYGRRVMPISRVGRFIHFTPAVKTASTAPRK